MIFRWALGILYCIYLKPEDVYYHGKIVQCFTVFENGCTMRLNYSDIIQSLIVMAFMRKDLGIASLVNMMKLSGVSQRKAGALSKHDSI